MRKTYLEFGSLVKGNKEKYETLHDSKFSSLYDAYMFSRYFRDIFILQNKKRLSDLNYHLHDIKDLKFSFVVYAILLSTKIKRYYEFGSTIFERFFYIKYLENTFSKKTKLKKYYGNDISKFFIYFSNNIFRKFFDCFAVQKFEKKYLNKSVFFAKGISLLYEKKNKTILENVFFHSHSGFFDFSILKKSKNRYLNTGKKLYFLGYKDFYNILKKNKKKHFFFRKIELKKNKIYFECIYGNKDILRKYNDTMKNLKVKKNDKKYLDFNEKFYNLEKFKTKVAKLFNK